ncbi:MAG: hypothetical protein J6C50_02540 [Rickettsiales bacterium]|nr:hypothetical protein [Rickettsiales bacterium]
MEKEKLKDKIKNIFNDIIINIKNTTNETLFNNTYNKTYLMRAVLPFIFAIISIYFKHLSIFVILNIIAFLAYNIKNININSYYKYANLLLYLYIVVPTFSYIYLLNNSKIGLLVWIFISILLLKITSYLYKNILDDIIFNNSGSKKMLFTYTNAILVAIVIGIISSIFLKQKLITFIVINIILAGLIFAQDIFNEKINLYTNNKLESKQYLNTTIQIYNNFILIIPFVAFLMSINVIK